MSDHPTDQEAAEAELAADERRRRLQDLRMDRELRDLLEAERAPALQWWDVDRFLSEPRPVALIDGFLYRDSLATLFGAPGCGKTFLALDMALRIATGRSWAARDTGEGPVVYVMAEGQAVNGDRVEAWLERNGADVAELRERFYVVPHAVLLTMPALGAFLDHVADLRPALIVLDTKNAMLVGNEDASSDWATTRRALDAIRTTSDACVMLVDHTGYGDQTRQRGSSAQLASMDTQVRVEKTDVAGAPAVVTATVTRDKAAEEGATESFRMRMSPPSAVLVHAEDEAATTDLRPVADWRAHPIPDELGSGEGRGGAALIDLARFMAADAVGDRGAVGVSRAEALREIGLKHDNRSGRAAWSSLIEGGWIEPAEGVKSPTQRHRWNLERHLRSAS